MKKWIIPVIWEMSGKIEISANTLSEAMDKVKKILEKNK